MHIHPTGVSRAGSVVLEIGGDVGAAVVVVPPSFSGLEIEIRAQGERWAEVHTAVRERERPGGGSLHAALFESLSAGSYQIRVRRASPADEAGTTVISFEVTGGQVTEVGWPPV